MYMIALGPIPPILREALCISLGQPDILTGHHHCDARRALDRALKRGQSTVHSHTKPNLVRYLPPSFGALPRNGTPLGELEWANPRGAILGRN